MKKRIILLLLSSFFLIWGSVLLSFFSHSPKEFIDQIISSISSEEKPDPSVEFIFWWDIMLARGIDFWAKKEGYDRIFTGDNSVSMLSFRRVYFICKSGKPIFKESKWKSRKYLSISCKYRKYQNTFRSSRKQPAFIVFGK